MRKFLVGLAITGVLAGTASAAPGPPAAPQSDSCVSSGSAVNRCAANVTASKVGTLTLRLGIHTTGRFVAVCTKGQQVWNRSGTLGRHASRSFSAPFTNATCSLRVVGRNGNGQTVRVFAALLP